MTESASGFPHGPTADPGFLFEARTSCIKRAAKGKVGGAKTIKVAELRGGEVAVVITEWGKPPASTTIILDAQDVWRLCQAWLQYRAGRPRA